MVAADTRIQYELPAREEDDGEEEGAATEPWDVTISQNMLWPSPLVNTHIC